MNETRRAEAIHEDVKALEDKLNNEKVMNERLLKEFDRKSTEIMRGCYHLLGFRPKFNERSIRLTLPDKKDQFLEFRVDM